MAEIVVRQWSAVCFAAYILDGDPYGRFVGTETTRHGALSLADSHVRTCQIPCHERETGQSSTEVEAVEVERLDYDGGSAGRSRSVPTTRVARPTASSPSDSRGEERRR